MTEFIQEYLGLHPLVVVLFVVVFDLPRDLLSFLTISIGRLFEAPVRKVPATGSISVIIPAFNAQDTLRHTLDSLKSQTIQLHQVIVVSDGSTDLTPLVAEYAQCIGLIDFVVHNEHRLGVSAACNKALVFTTGDYVLLIDSDTTLLPDACEQLLQKISQLGYAAVSGNIGVSNVPASLWTGLQQIEYMLAIDLNRSFMDKFNAISCLSGALTLCRTQVLKALGGLSPGSGQDLELTLRLRRAGHRVGFASRAWAFTDVPENGAQLIRQRLRWDRDAIRIHMFQYRQFAKEGLREPLGNTLQRLDFLNFIFIPTLLLMFLPSTLVGLNPEELWITVVGTYVLLLGVTFLGLTFAFLAYRGPIRPFYLFLLPICPLYFGLFLKVIRLYAYCSEAIWQASRFDNFVPQRVRKILYQGH